MRSQNARKSAASFFPSTDLTSRAPPKRMFSGTGMRSAMYQKSGTPKIAASRVTFVSPANQSWMNGSTPRRMDIFRLARPAVSPRFSTSSESSSR